MTSFSNACPKYVIFYYTCFPYDIHWPLIFTYNINEVVSITNVQRRSVWYWFYRCRVFAIAQDIIMSEYLVLTKHTYFHYMILNIISFPFNLESRLFDCWWTNVLISINFLRSEFLIVNLVNPVFSWNSKCSI